MSRIRRMWLYLTAPLLLLAACSLPAGVSFSLDFGGDALTVGRGGTITLSYRASGASVQSIRYRFAHQAASTTVALASNAGSVSITVPNDTPVGASVLSASLISEGVAVRTANVTVTVVDEGAPSVSWVAPAWGSRLSGTVTLQAAATDDTGIARVEFLIGGQVIGSSATGSVSVDTRNLPNGTVIVTARAVDISGKTATAERTFQIGNVGTNVPSIQWALPYSYQSFVPGEEIEFAVEVSDTSGNLSSVKFYVGQDLVHTVTNLTDVASEREVSFTFGGFDTVVGPVVLRAEATNAFGGMSSALRNIVVVAPEAPVIDRTRPMVWWDRDYVWNGKVVERTIQLGIVAQDDVAVDYFDWTLNGTAFVERVQIDRDDTRNPPFYKVWNWNSLTVPDGSYTLEVVAVDTSGNRSETVRVSLTVRNESTPIVDNERPLVWFDEDCVWNNKVVQDDDVPICVVSEDNRSVDYFDVFLNGSWVREVNAQRYDGILPSSGYTRYEGTWYWDTLAYPDGTYQWAVEAVDSSGNRSSRATVTLRVANGPSIAWDEDTVWDGQIVSGEAHTFRVEQINGRQFSELDVYVNGSLYDRFSDPEDFDSWEWDWNTRDYPDGTYEITAIARDLSGNSSAPITVTVRVANGPSIAWDEDTVWDGQIVSGGAHTFRVEQINGRQFSELDVYVNGSLYDRFSDSDLDSWEWAWNTFEYPDGTYEITAIAHDLSGNSSAPISVTVHVQNAIDVEWTDFGIYTGDRIYVVTDTEYSDYPPPSAGDVYLAPLSVIVTMPEAVVPDFTPQDSTAADLWFMDLWVDDLYTARYCIADIPTFEGLWDCDYPILYDGNPFRGYTVDGRLRVEVPFAWVVRQEDLAAEYKLTVQVSIATTDSSGISSPKVDKTVYLDTLNYQFRTTVDGWTNGPLFEFDAFTSPTDIIVTLEGNLPTEAVCNVRLMFGGEGTMVPVDAFWDVNDDSDLSGFYDWLLRGGYDSRVSGSGGSAADSQWEEYLGTYFEFQYVGDNQWRWTWNPYVPLGLSDEIGHDNFTTETDDEDWNDYYGVYHSPFLSSYDSSGWGRGQGDDFWEWNASDRPDERHIGARVELCSAFGNENVADHDGNRWHYANHVVVGYRGYDSSDPVDVRYRNP